MAPLKSVLVTGAGGFIAGRVLRALAEERLTVHALVSPRGRLPDPAGAIVHAADVASPDALEVIRAARPSVILHLAVARSDRTAAERLTAARTNVLGTATVLEGAHAAGTERVVHVGGALEYGRRDSPMDETTVVDPEGWYGATKAAAAMLAARAAVPTVILRPFLVYGPGQPPDRLIPTVLRAARDGGTVPLTAAGPARDWVHVDDVVAAIIAAATREPLAHGTVINVGSGDQHTNEDVVALAREVTGRPIAVSSGVIAPRPWDRSAWRADPRALERLLGIRPRDLRTGLADTWAQWAA